MLLFLQLKIFVFLVSNFANAVFLSLVRWW